MRGSLTLTAEEAAQVRGILARHLPPGVRVYAFGSRARGKPKPWSDLDLVLEGDGPLPLSVLGALAGAFDEALLDWKVDLVDRATISPAFGRIIDGSKVALNV